MTYQELVGTERVSIRAVCRRGDPLSARGLHQLAQHTKQPKAACRVKPRRCAHRPVHRHADSTARRPCSRIDHRTAAISGSSASFTRTSPRAVQVAWSEIPWSLRAIAFWRQWAGRPAFEPRAGVDHDRMTGRSLNRRLADLVLVSEDPDRLVGEGPMSSFDRCHPRRRLVDGPHPRAGRADTSSLSPRGRVNGTRVHRGHYWYAHRPGGYKLASVHAMTRGD